MIVCNHTGSAYIERDTTHPKPAMITFTDAEKEQLRWFAHNARPIDRDAIDVAMQKIEARLRTPDIEFKQSSPFTFTMTADNCEAVLDADVLPGRADKQKLQRFSRLGAKEVAVSRTEFARSYDVAYVKDMWRELLGLLTEERKQLHRTEYEALFSVQPGEDGARSLFGGDSRPFVSGQKVVLNIMSQGCIVADKTLAQSGSILVDAAFMVSFPVLAACDPSWPIILAGADIGTDPGLSIRDAVDLFKKLNSVGGIRRPDGNRVLMQFAPHANAAYQIACRAYACHARDTGELPNFNMLRSACATAAARTYRHDKGKPEEETYWHSISGNVTYQRYNWALLFQHVALDMETV